MPTTFIRNFTALVPDDGYIWEVFESLSDRARELAATLDGDVYQAARYGSVATNDDQVRRDTISELRKVYADRGLQVKQLSSRTMIIGDGNASWGLVVWAWFDRGSLDYNVEVNVEAHNVPDADRLRTALVTHFLSLAKRKHLAELSVVRQWSYARTTDHGPEEPPVPEVSRRVATPKKKPNWGLRWAVIGVLIAIAAIVVSIFQPDIREYLLLHLFNVAPSAETPGP